MSRIVLVACSKTKLNHAAPAAALYSSALFRKSLLAAIDSRDSVYILSALHGILPLDRVISPYDVTLSAMSKADRLRWAALVERQLAGLVRVGGMATLYSGEKYSQPVREILARLGVGSREPLRKLSFGPRLSRLQSINNESGLSHLSKQLMPLLRRLWRAQAGGRRFAETKGSSDWPKRGVYLILDPQGDETARMPRIVRIGTHAVSAGSRTTLWNRLSTHRGTLDGRGSHRSSIFRSHVGRSLTRSLPEAHWPESWARGQSAPVSVRGEETALERLVSEHISRLRVLWLDVCDASGPDSDRAYLERNLIALFSRQGILYPARLGTWLGTMSPDWRIASSGLWNLDHLFSVPDPGFVEILSYYVHVTLGAREAPLSSLAPQGWRKRLKSDAVTDQHELFRG